jgi:hypothetical protein
MSEKELSVEERRAARKANLSDEEKAQYELDLEAVDALEQEHGDSNVHVLRVPYTPGLPVLVAVRAPRDPEVKRFRAKASGDDVLKKVEASAELGESCRLYPDKDVFDQLVKARPNLKIDCGVKALGLVVAKSADEGKG